MIDILIVRDGGASKVPKQVADLEEAEAWRARGFEVEVVTPPVVTDAAVAAVDDTAHIETKATKRQKKG